MDNSNAVMSIDTIAASDDWGFLGRVLVGEVEVYRTVRAYTTCSEALQATTSLLAGVLGPRLAAAEWQATSRLSHDGPISAAPVPPGE